jgi:hypothetical protein
VLLALVFLLVTHAFFCADNMIVSAEVINTEAPATDDPKDVDGGDVLAADIPPRSGNHF